MQDSKLRLISVLPFNSLFIINNNFNFHTFKKMNSIFIILSFFNTAHRSLLFVISKLLENIIKTSGENDIIKILMFTTQSFKENIIHAKVIMQGKLFQRCTHLFNCSVLSLGGNVNTGRMSTPDMGPIFHIKNQWNILVTENHFVNYQNYQNFMLFISLDTKRTTILAYKFRPERTGFNMYVEYTQLS